MEKRTKIVCTIGPSSEKVTILNQMMKAGMDIARLNFSHGTYERHSLLIKNIRQAAKSANKVVSILQDLQGPKIRVGELPKKGISLKQGEEVALCEGATASQSKIPIVFKGFCKVLKKGDGILLDDGLMELKVKEVQSGGEIIARVQVGGVLMSHKGVNLPDSRLAIPSLTAKDKKDVRFGLNKRVDFIALSFVRKQKDILELRKLLPRRNPPLIVAKIEKAEAVKNFDEILDVSDGIMIARGDLALEIPAEQVPLVQKEIIEKCLKAAKPVIVATQMLHSMILNPRPTRAEVSDVANAVCDHADALMLSGETANGKYPIAAVGEMAKIIRQTEKSRFDDLKIGLEHRVPHILEKSLEEAAGVIARHADLKAIVAADDGHFISRLSSLRPEMPIYACVKSESAARQLNLRWGVFPIVLKSFCPDKALYILKRNKLVRTGDKILRIFNRQLIEILMV